MTDCKGRDKKIHIFFEFHRKRGKVRVKCSGVHGRGSKGGGLRVAEGSQPCYKKFFQKLAKMYMLK